MDQHPIPKGGSPLPDIDTRHKLAVKMIQNARVPKKMPEGFKPLLASSEELRHYGIPPKPNKETHPLYHAKWEEILSRPLGIIVPQLSTETASYRNRRRPNPNEKGAQHTAGPWPWSGAVIQHPAGQFIDSASASWTVPNVFPPHSAWNSNTNNWNDGEWYCSIWAGIDGTFDAGNDVVQSGTDIWVIVKNGVLTQTVAAWAEWYPAGTIWFKNFPIQPGDTIYCGVCLPGDSTSHAVAIMTNLTSNLSTFLGFDSPNTAANTQGHLAEWIVEAYGGFPYANYGTTFLYECTAGTSKQNLDLTGATIWDLVPSGSTTAWSTTKQISSSMIQVQPPKDPGAGFRTVRQQ